MNIAPAASILADYQAAHGRQQGDHAHGGIDRSAARAISAVLKTLSNEKRLTLLSLLIERPRTVSELQRLSGLRQSEVSQILTRCRLQGLVMGTRRGRFVTYQPTAHIATAVVATIAPTILKSAGLAQG